MNVAHCPLALAARASDLWAQLIYDSTDHEFEVLSRTIAVHDGHGRFVRPLASINDDAKTPSGVRE